jgi:hypothetical protein
MVAGFFICVKTLFYLRVRYRKVSYSVILLNDIETISPQPMLFITGDRAHSREFSEDAIKKRQNQKNW